MNVSEHLDKVPEQRDLDWIKSALQLAIALEHATLPPYVAATYSMQEQAHLAYEKIRGVLMGEMCHMAAMSNLLAAMGGVPQIKSLKPVFPGQGLPGGAEPDLFVCIAPLSKPQLKNFMRLEAPASLLDPAYGSETYESIANFYAAIRAAILDNIDAVCTAIAAPGKKPNQVSDNIDYPIFVWTDQDSCVKQILSALDAITAQGEGLAGDAFHADPASQADETHYARFAQIYYGKALSRPKNDIPVTPDTVADFFRGPKIPFPKVTNFLAVPSDGYAKLLDGDPDNKAAVAADLELFDNTYSQMLADLDTCWNGDPATWWPTLGKAVEGMAKLRVFGCFNVMKHRVPPELVQRLSSLYGKDDYEMMATYTRLDQPVFYGPRFINKN